MFLRFLCRCCYLYFCNSGRYHEALPGGQSVPKSGNFMVDSPLSDELRRHIKHGGHVPNVEVVQTFYVLQVKQNVFHFDVMCRRWFSLTPALIGQCRFSKCLVYWYHGSEGIFSTGHRFGMSRDTIPGFHLPCSKRSVYIFHLNNIIFKIIFFSLQNLSAYPGGIIVTLVNRDRSIQQQRSIILGQNAKLWHVHIWHWQPISALP